MIAELVCTSSLAAILALAPAPGPGPDPGVARPGPEPAGRMADVNLDGVVDYEDVIDHLFLWGPCDDVVCWGDLDTDGFVDVLDFLLLLDSLDQLSLMVHARGT